MKPAKARPISAHVVLLATAAFLLVAPLPSCLKGMQCVGATPVPELNSVSPTAVNSGILPAGLTLTGSGFVAWSTVFMDSVPLTTHMIDSHHLNATITWQDLSADNITSGQVGITVTNAGHVQGGLFGCSNGGTSQVIWITIQ